MSFRKAGKFIEDDERWRDVDLLDSVSRRKQGE
jgi:hypothetical protein